MQRQTKGLIFMWYISQGCEDKKLWLLFFNVLRMYAESCLREIYSHVLSVCACALYKYILLFRYQPVMVHLLSGSLASYFQDNIQLFKTNNLARTHWEILD